MFGSDLVGSLSNRVVTLFVFVIFYRLRILIIAEAKPRFQRGRFGGGDRRQIVWFVWALSMLFYNLPLKSVIFSTLH